MRRLLWLVLLLAGCGQPSAPAPAASAQPAVCADLVKGCRIGPLTVRAETLPTALRPFKLWVAAPAARSVTADLAMVDMDMGQTATGCWRSKGDSLHR